jgi:molecular chaperone DnaK (HSP70)
MDMNASKLAKASSRKKYLDGKSALEGTASNGFLDNIYVELTPETDLQMKARNEFRTCEKEAKKKIEGLWDTLQKIINDKKNKTPQAQKEEYEKETKERVFGVLARYFGDSLYETEETKDAHVVKNAAMTKDEFVQKFMGLRQKNGGLHEYRRTC